MFFILEESVSEIFFYLCVCVFKISLLEYPVLFTWMQCLQRE